MLAPEAMIGMIQKQVPELDWLNDPVVESDVEVNPNVLVGKLPKVVEKVIVVVRRLYDQMAEPKYVIGGLVPPTAGPTGVPTTWSTACTRSSRWTFMFPAARPVPRPSFRRSWRYSR